MTVNTSHRRPRRARDSLSLTEIVAAANELVQSEGLTALTIRRLAQRLGSSPMALYGHIHDRDALLVQMLEVTCSSMPYDSVAPDPYVRVEQRMIAVHDFFVDHLWIPTLMTRGDLIATSMFGFADSCMGDFIAAGMTPAQALFAFGECWHLMLGELLDRHPHDPGDRPTQRESAILAMDVIAFPNYAHVLDNLDPVEGPPVDRFADSIHFIVTGIAALQ
jgi:AcrR family transcriptional regulator